MSGACTCPPWGQRWTFENPERCVACGGIFVPYSKARECHGAFECGGTCPKHRPLSPADHEAREGERRYESWLESVKDHGP